MWIDLYLNPSQGKDVYEYICTDIAAFSLGKCAENLFCNDYFPLKFWTVHRNFILDTKNKELPTSQHSCLKYTAFRGIINCVILITLGKVFSFNFANILAKPVMWNRPFGGFLLNLCNYFLYVRRGGFTHMYIFFRSFTPDGKALGMYSKESSIIQVRTRQVT